MKKKRTFWQPVGWGYYAEYRTTSQKREPPTFYMKSDSGQAREEFIREQSKMIRKFETDEEYIAYWRSVQALMRD